MEYKNKSLITAMTYFLMTGCCCLLVGSSLTQLMSMYNLSLDKVVVLGSVFALGRVVMVNFSGRICHKMGTRFCVIIGAAGFAVFLFGIGLVHNYYFSYILCFIGGCSQAMQDTATPILVAKASKENYSVNMSIGQALFDAGCFLTPFLIMVMLKSNLPFYYSYFVMGILALVLLFMGFNLDDDRNEDEEEEELVIPIYVKNFARTIALMFALDFLYSSIFGAYCTYTTSFGEFMGLSEADSSLLLTLFNIGAMMGSFAFAPVLKKIEEVDLMIFNLAVSFVLLVVCLLCKNVLLYYIMFTLIGFFLGVLFGLAISVITRISYKDIKSATPKIGLLSGLADVLTPVCTGFIIARTSIMFSMNYILVTTAVCVVLGFIIKKDIVKEK